MLLQNFYNAVTWGLKSSTTTSSKSLGVYSPTGSYYTTSNPPTPYTFFTIPFLPVARQTTDSFTTVAQSNVAPNVLAIVFGSDNTPPSISDYYVKSIITNLVCTAVSTSSDDNSATVTVTINNTNSSSVTINEVGICCTPWAFYTLNLKGSHMCIWREVLSEPITVEAEGYFTYSYTITLDYQY